MRRISRAVAACVFLFGMVVTPTVHRLHHALHSRGDDHRHAPVPDAEEELLDPDALLDEELGSARDDTDFGPLFADTSPVQKTPDHHHGGLPGAPHGRGSLAHGDLLLCGAFTIAMTLLVAPAAPLPEEPLVAVPASLPPGLPGARGPPIA